MLPLILAECINVAMLLTPESFFLGRRVGGQELTSRARAGLHGRRAMPNPSFNDRVGLHMDHLVPSC
jgi:hypothetical protein